MESILRVKTRGNQPGRGQETGSRRNGGGDGLRRGRGNGEVQRKIRGTPGTPGTNVEVQRKKCGTPGTPGILMSRPPANGAGKIDVVD